MPKTKPPLSAIDVFARNLRLVRLAKGLTQEDIAFGAGISRVYISRIERGAVNASLKQLDAIATTLGVPLHDLTNPKLFPSFDGAG